MKQADTLRNLLTEHKRSSFNGRLVRVHFLLYMNKLNRGQKRGKDVEADKRSWRDSKGRKYSL